VYWTDVPLARLEGEGVTSMRASRVFLLRPPQLVAWSARRARTNTAQTRPEPIDLPQNTVHFLGKRNLVPVTSRAAVMESPVPDGA